MNYISFSGGKDSTAIAILWKGQGIDFELVFSDTGAELPETYHHITKVSRVLGKKLTVVCNGTFYQWLVHKNFLLPHHGLQWCTGVLKSMPLAHFFKPEDTVAVGIRADEQHRLDEKRTKHKNHYTKVYPLVEGGLDKNAVRVLCEKHDLLNPVYSWRSNCSCFCCFQQRLQDWRNLYEHHADLYMLAEAWEKQSFMPSKIPYGWRRDYHLDRIRQVETCQLKLFETEGEEEPCILCR